MEKWYSRFRRGDVWFLHFPTENGDGIEGSSVQQKSRPYLIVSCEENNLNAPTFNVVPIGTRDNDHLPMHVYYRYQDGSDGGRNQIVFCEQITTVSALVFNNPRSRFMYSFNLEFMNKVDDALASQLGLRPRIADMHILERIVHELAEVELAKVESAKKEEAGVRMEKIAEYLAKTFNLTITTEQLQNGCEYRDAQLQMADRRVVQEMRETAQTRRGVIPTPQPTLVADSVQPSVSSESTTESSTTAKTKKKNNRWTPESRAEFLEYYRTHTILETAEHYDMKKSSVATQASVFRKQVGENVT